VKSFTNIVGIVLILIGIFSLVYQGFSYTTQEKVAELKVPQVAQLQLNETQEKTVHFPPLLGGICLITGIFLVVVVRIFKK